MTENFPGDTVMLETSLPYQDRRRLPNASNGRRATVGPIEF